MANSPLFLLWDLFAWEHLWNDFLYSIYNNNQKECPTSSNQLINIFFRSLVVLLFVYSIIITLTFFILNEFLKLHVVSESFRIAINTCFSTWNFYCIAGVTCLWGAVFNNDKVRLLPRRFILPEATVHSRHCISQWKLLCPSSDFIVLSISNYMRMFYRMNSCKDYTDKCIIWASYF